MVDYSKWKNIEVSDDEDDTHPNIDTPSLFKWRHEARVQRMKELEEEKKRVEEKKRKIEAEKKWVSEKMKQDAEDEVKKELEKLEMEEKNLAAEESEVSKKEKLMPWNVDTLSKDSWSKTIINKPKARVDTSNMTEEEKEEHYRNFVKENKSKIEKYGMLSRGDDCKQYLLENPDLVCEETANYLAIWCLNLQMEEKTQLMEHVSKQVISMQYILELAKSMNRDPRSCVASFFTRIQTAEKEYQDAFNDELNGFKERIKKRAKEKLDAIMKEIEEEEKQKRLGPGGLDPMEVLESLPDEMKACFESRDISQLQGVISKMPEDDAKYHLKRCIDSGLWIPDAKKDSKDDDEEEDKSQDGKGDGATDGKNEDEEPTYETPGAASGASSTSS